MCPVQVCEEMLIVVLARHYFPLFKSLPLSSSIFFSHLQVSGPNPRRKEGKRKRKETLMHMRMQ